MNLLKNKEVYNLIHDTNSGISQINNALWYLNKAKKADRSLYDMELKYSIEALEHAKKRITEAVDQYYKSLKEQNQ